jgi:hypothetical protein
MLKEELGKMISNATFYVGIIAVVILLLLGIVYTSPFTGEEFNVLDFMISDNRNELLKESDLREGDIIVKGLDSYLDMFLPIVAVIPFVAILCGEKKNNNTRFEIYRVGKTRYVAGKIFAAMLIGGSVSFFGYVLFSLIIMMIFQNGMSMAVAVQNQFLEEETVVTAFLYQCFGLGGIYIMKFIRMFLYGAFVTVPAIGLSAVIKNRYIILSVPFMIFYLLQKVIEKRMDADLHYFLPNMIGNVYATEVLRLVLVFGSITVAVFLWYRIYLGRKCDCGED